MNDLIVGIDASRNRSGGARAHIIGLLTSGDPLKHGVKEVHLWAFKTLLDSIPDQKWLVKHNPRELEQSLSRQLWWQATKLSREILLTSCDILFSTDASTLCRFSPMVVLSQDMLSYEPGVMKYFGYTKARLRLLAILFLQNYAFRYSDGVIFLTKYASKVIQRSCGALQRTALIPHGVGEDFKSINLGKRLHSEMRPIRCLYVSNTEMYKHQWVVVSAIQKMRKRGHNVTLTLIGDGFGKAQQLLNKQCIASDPKSEFIEKIGFVPQKELPRKMASADIFIFASSCENMPVTLIEAMAVGLPIACSNRGPMQEVLADGGIYFDPEDEESIAIAIEQIILNPDHKIRIAKRAKTLSEQYSWLRCSNETWEFIVKVYKDIKK